MNTLYEFGEAVIEIRDAVDNIEVKGAKNAALVSMIFQKCNEIITQINLIAEQANSSEKTEPQAGDTDGQVDS